MAGPSCAVCGLPRPAHGLARLWDTGSPAGPVARGRERPGRSGDPVRGQGRSCPHRMGKNAHLVKTTLFKTTNYNYAVRRGRGCEKWETVERPPSLSSSTSRQRKGPCPKAGTLVKIDHKVSVRTDYLPATSLMDLDSLSTATSQSMPRMISGGTMRMMLAPMAVTSRWLSMQ